MHITTIRHEHGMQMHDIGMTTSNMINLKDFPYKLTDNLLKMNNSMTILLCSRNIWLLISVAALVSSPSDEISL
jgi:ribose 5-phosphate isomerase RpiB